MAVSHTCRCRREFFDELEAREFFDDLEAREFVELEARKGGGKGGKKGGKGGKEEVKPSGGWKAHSDPVTSVAIHPTGCVVATCSGERKLEALRDDASDSSGGSDSDGEEKGDEMMTTQDYQ